MMGYVSERVGGEGWESGVPDQMTWPLRLRSDGPLAHSSTRLIYATSTPPNISIHPQPHPLSNTSKKKRKQHSTDPNIPIQPRRNHTRNETDHIPDVLPRLFAHALVGEREGVLALEGVHEEAVHEVDGRD